MKKAEILKHWKGIEPDQNINISAVPYKHIGSTYDQDGIRLTGSAEFIDSMLSKLKELLNHENGRTRLQLVYKQSTDRHTQAPLDSFNCYIQVHTRGGEAIHMNSFIENITGKPAVQI